MIRKIARETRKLYRGWLHTRKVLSQLKSKNELKIYYFGIPMHPNIGDLAQCVCIRNFLESEYFEHDVVEIDTKVFMDERFKLRKELLSKINKNDLIFFQSGYCTQDIGGIEDLMHQAVIKDYPDNKLVILPQTVFFNSKERKDRASRIYNSHKHLLFLSRDKISFQISKKMFPDIPVLLFPDIVTTLIGKYNFDYDRSGILLCTRNDTEKFYSNEELDELKEKLSLIDKVDQFDTTISKKINANTPNLVEYIENHIKSYAKYRVVITDRYHGTIFSLIANTPVIVIKTNDHKVETGVDWFKGVYDNNVIYCNTLKDAECMVNDILKRQGNKNNKSYFSAEYYDKLKQLITETLG